MKKDDVIFLSQLELNCIIGIFDWERKKKQKILIDFEIPCDVNKASQTDSINDTTDYKSITKSLISFVSKSNFFLIETLAENVAQIVLNKSRADWVRISISKPGAIRFSKNVGISICRKRSDIKNQNRVFLSLGSNLNKKRMMLKTIRALSDEFVVVNKSNVYESTAIGNESAPSFLNAVVEIKTHLKPEELKKRLAKIELSLGRKRNYSDKFASRHIDIDIIFFGTKVLRSKKNRIPHPDTVSAPYILLPLLEIDPFFIHPEKKQSIIEILGSCLDKKSSFMKVDIK